MRLVNRPDWFSRAACRGIPTALFFPDSQAAVPPEVDKLCDRCPVRRECLAYAVTDAEIKGVWAATSERDRAELRRRGRPARRRTVWETG